MITILSQYSIHYIYVNDASLVLFNELIELSLFNLFVDGKNTSVVLIVLFCIKAPRNLPKIQKAIITGVKENKQ